MGCQSPKSFSLLKWRKRVGLLSLLVRRVWTDWVWSQCGETMFLGTAIQVGIASAATWVLQIFFLMLLLKGSFYHFCLIIIFRNSLTQNPSLFYTLFLVLNNTVWLDRPPYSPAMLWRVPRLHWFNRCPLGSAFTTWCHTRHLGGYWGKWPGPSVLRELALHRRIHLMDE